MRKQFQDINDLYRQSADVIFQDTHVSGHACQEEIKLIYSLLHPKYAIPVHGEFKHRKAQAGVAAELGIDKEHILMIPPAMFWKLMRTVQKLLERYRLVLYLSTVLALVMSEILLCVTVSIWLRMVSLSWY